MAQISPPRAARPARLHSPRVLSQPVCASRRTSHSVSKRGETSFSRPAKASSSRRWVAASTSARPRHAGRGISTSGGAHGPGGVCTLMAWSFDEGAGAGRRPSLQPGGRIISEEILRSIVEAVVAENFSRLDEFFGTSNTAVTWPCSHAVTHKAQHRRARPVPARRHRAGWICRRRVSPVQQPRGHGKTRYRAVSIRTDVHGSTDRPPGMRESVPGDVVRDVLFFPARSLSRSAFLNQGPPERTARPASRGRAS